MPLSKESFKAATDYLSKAVALIGPGLLICDVVFKKGLIHGGIENIYSIILLIIWSVILSIPYYVATTLIALTHDTTANLQSKDEDPTLYEAALPFMILLIFLTYVMLKTLNYLNFGFISARIGIPIRYEQMIVSVLSIFIIAFPIGSIYYRALDFFLAKCVKL